MSVHAPDVTPAVLEVAGIDVHFDGVVALDGVSLTVREHQIVGVIGPNGAGKTTLFNAVSSFVTPVTGTITYRGRSLIGVPTWRLAHLGIARTLQGLGLFPTLTVLENVIAGAPSRARLAADMLGFPGSDRRTGRSPTREQPEPRPGPGHCEDGVSGIVPTDRVRRGCALR